MSRRLRLTLLLFGLALMCCSLVALAYAFWPVEGLRVQATLAPTLFVPP